MSDVAPGKRGVRGALACFGAGLLLGGGLCLVAAIVLIPGRVSSRVHGNETAAIGALKITANAESIFREGDKDRNGALDYGSLAQLAQAQLIDSVLGSGTKQGYLLRAGASTSTSELLWFATATPFLPGKTGNRYFCANQAGVIYYTTGGSFSMNTTDCAIPSNAVRVGR